MDITRWSILKPDWLWFFAVKDEETLYSQQKQELELLITKFMLKLKKVGKITRSFRYGLNHILYDYSVEVTNRSKGLDLVDRVPEDYGQKFVTLYRRQWPKLSQRKRNARRQSGCLRRFYKQLRKEEKWKAREKEKDISNWMQSCREKQGEIGRSS